MSIICDFHIHSKYSRATSKDMYLENIAKFAKIKGIDVVATGDFVHPQYLSEIYSNLIEAENGLYKLAISNSKVRFILSTEISSIYKKNNKVRKIHNLVLMPSIESAKKFSEKLDKIGNIHSDGRPILGLDSKYLLEIALEIDENTIFIPAHIWTPWFSLFGAKSGFDSIEECFEELTDYIFALETGLSSDPPMNWRLSALDRFTLVSNSDAHSPSKIAREANIIDCDKNYFSIKEALQNKNRVTTIEFFPEEGKYHYDGHRKCNVKLDPEEAIKLNNTCPICQKPITMGVYHRIIELADRDKVEQKLQNFLSFIPLEQIISQVFGFSPTSKKVKMFYENIIQEFGSELTILKDVPVKEIEKYSEILALGIDRMKKREVILEPGYDGEYGKIIVITDKDREYFQVKKGFFAVKCEKIKPKTEKQFKQLSKDSKSFKQASLINIDKNQLEAINSNAFLTIVESGPGTGKTFTLIKRVEYLLEKGTEPDKIYIITFTNKACEEIRERLNSNKINVETFHSLCLKILQKSECNVSLLSPEEQIEIVKKIFKNEKIRNYNKIVNLISLAKKGIIKEEIIDKIKEYNSYLNSNNLLDFDDIILKGVEFLKNNNPLKLDHLLIDEFQDIDEHQFIIIKELSNNIKSLFVIGDSNQSIYGFRGGSAKFFNKIREISNNRKYVNLTKNFRSCQNILDFSENFLVNHKKVVSNRDCNALIKLFRFDNEIKEAKFIAKKIKELTGGFELNSKYQNREYINFNEIAILFRLHFVSRNIEKVFKEEGIPFQKSKDIVYAERDNIDLKAEKVNLLSFHAAKGLDFKVIFIIGTQEGIVPFDDNLEEEKRLFYVAVTRAKDFLFITKTDKRFLYGEKLNGKPSPFLKNFNFQKIEIKRRKKGLFL